MKRFVFPIPVMSFMLVPPRSGYISAPEEIVRRRLPVDKRAGHGPARPAPFLRTVACKCTAVWRDAAQLEPIQRGALFALFFSSTCPRFGGVIHFGRKKLFQWRNRRAEAANAKSNQGHGWRAIPVERQRLGLTVERKAVGAALLANNRGVMNESLLRQVDHMLFFMKRADNRTG